MDHGYIQSKENYQAGSEPENLYLHFVPFIQGMLYVGSIEPLPEESLTLIRSPADIRSNLSKIHEHGSRADGIVQSMLLHSRGGDGN